MSYHNPGGYSVDISVSTAKFTETLRRLVDHAGKTIALIGDGRMFLVRPTPVKTKVHARYRTRSPRWRAGSRHAKKIARAAKRQGRRSPLAPERTWAQMGWQELGWTTDDPNVTGV